jgi:hypothetical protein
MSTKISLDDILPQETTSGALGISESDATVTEGEQEMFTDPSSLCTTGKPPLILDGIIMQLLIAHFSVSDYIKIEQLKKYVWKPDSDEGQDQPLVIAPNYRIRWQNIQSRPAIIIKRNVIQSRKIAIDDYVGPAEHPGDGDHYIRARVGSHTIFCLSTNGSVAEMLASEVNDELTEFAPLIRRDLNFGRFEETQIGEVTQIDEHNTHFVVPVTIGYAWCHTWKLTPIAPWYKTIGIEPTG